MLKFILLAICLTLSTLSFAEDSLPIDKFSTLPILHDGRIKPLDSFARIEITKFSKRENPSDLSPLVWLADSLFNPAAAVQTKIFLVDDAVTRHNLGLEERQSFLYSYLELASGLEKTTTQVEKLLAFSMKDLTQSDRELLNVHENALEYTHILRSFSSVLPLNISLSEKWRQKADLSQDAPINFSSLQKILPEIENEVRNIIQRKGDNPSVYNLHEQEIVTLGWQLRIIAGAGNHNTLLRVIPTLGDAGFSSPWDIINAGAGTPATQSDIQNWIKLADAWQNQNQQEWLSTLQLMQEKTQSVSPLKLKVEVIYNQIALFKISIFLFAASFCFSLAFFAGKNSKIYKASFVFLSLAILVQTIGIMARVFLMDRPPVGTLYESILFVGLIAPFVSLFVERRLKNGNGVLSGAISGVMLGILAFSLMGEGDNMKVLGAVLNTRFWLTTHVLCITIGYGWCLLTAVLAHLILFGKLFGRTTQNTENELIKTLTTHSLFSLLFTTVGTILGGIWADQSWGRFWGWDPKENGALLIVLWLIWVIHGKIAGQISQLIWMCGMAFLSVIVSIAWVGVNLLGVGLHSYGFIDGVFWGLGGFIAFEIILIGFLAVQITRRGRLLNAG